MVGRKNITYSSRPTRAARAAHARGDKEFRTYDTSYIRPRTSHAPIVIAIILVVAVAVTVFFLVRACTPAPEPTLPEGEEAIVVVDEGEAASAIGQTLVDEGLIGSAGEFVDHVRAQGVESSLIPGTYLLVGGTSVDDIIATLQAGPDSTADRLVVPEGLTRDATAQIVAEATRGRITADDFLAASADASRWAGDYPFLTTAGTNTLEGFLFPKTYMLTARDGADEAVAMMLDQFGVETATVSFAYPESRGFNLYDSVKLASVVEKEANADTMTQVASVFYNRLASDHPYLDSDATTAYEVGDDPTAEQVHADTPYSTYTNPGLPPTPICSPSLAAIEAVCNPDETNYMYFYFVPDDAGALQYYFSETLAQHEAAIANAAGGSGTDVM